jgi:uncharacterized protein
MFFIRLINKRTKDVVAENVRLADTFWLRLRGLLGRPEIQPGEGLCLIPCKQVHMYGMKYPLSIWFLDKDGRVCQVLDNLKPGQSSPYIKQARTVLEFPAGWAEKMDIEIGDHLIGSPAKPV